jgi:hypothetical protein
MFSLELASLDFSLGSNYYFQLSGFTLANGSFSKNSLVRIAKTSTPQGSEPFSFTKLYTHRVSGNLNLTIDLSNILVVPGYTPSTLTPKGFFIAAEYDNNASDGVIVFRKANIDGYTGCYNLLTNEYRLGLRYLPLVLLGEVGSAPTATSRLLNISTISGQEPQDTYIIIWGD